MGLTISALPLEADIQATVQHARFGPTTEVHMRKPHHPAFAPSPTLMPLPAAIRSSCVHGGLGSIDLDQALADPLGSHIRLGAGHGYDGAADSRDRGR
jgi:hypothetical protein